MTRSERLTVMQLIEQGKKQAERDPRYEHVRCPGCGLAFQRIDFGAAPHFFFCPEAAKGDAHLAVDHGDDESHASRGK
jgi:alpha-D-ribose 1-methylphosphonate 5-triphosphate synthase subunit PhnG